MMMPLSGPALACARRRVGISQRALARALHLSMREVIDLEARDTLDHLTPGRAAAILSALRLARMRQAQGELVRRSGA